MKVWYLAHGITIASFILAVGGAVFINPIILISLASTVFIFRSAERIRKKEKEIKELKPNDFEIDSIQFDIYRKCLAKVKEAEQELISKKVVIDYVDRPEVLDVVPFKEVIKVFNDKAKGEGK
jgi:hypothetical protein